MLLQLRCSVQPRPAANARFIQLLQEHLAPLRTSAVLALEPRLVLLQLQPAARSEVVVGLLVELLPVADTAAERASMYVVELLRVQPVVFGVINFEGKVRRNPGRLALVSVAGARS